MNILTFLATEPGVLLFVVCILGLIVGSFLNVVIYRLPIMMERDWRAQCAELMDVSVQSVTTHESFNLSQPRSCCPHCGHQITVLENIPLFSFIWQRGRCTTCQGPIAWRYPLVEASSAILAVIVTWQLGFGWPLLGALFLTWLLLAASMIDFDHQLLFDNMTLPFLWLGLLFNLFGVYTDIESSVIGAMVGYLSLWIVYKLFKWTTGKEGMGYGDFKLLAMLGAWLGWQALPVIILLSSLVGAVIGVLLILLRGHDRSVPIPFGPYLAMAGWLSLLWGDTLTHTYFLWIYP